MNAPVKVVGFLVALAALFGGAVGLGSVVGPVSEPATADGAEHDAAHDDPIESAGSTDPAGSDEELPGGLMVSQDGYTLRLAAVQASPGQDVPVAFSILGRDGPVTSYEVEHEKRLHLIAVRRDFTGFQHVHPELAPDGTWSTGLDLTAGQWRLYADFTPSGGDSLTLGADLAVAGDFQPAPPAAESRTDVVDGYTVSLEGDLVPGTDSELTLNVSRAGAPVTDLQPYLGAYGHLVALRGGDLAYLHVHPEGTPGDGSTQPGPDVTFFAAVPSAGTYHLYLDFQHQGVVRTAAFTLVTRGAPAATESEHGETGDDHGGH